VEKRFIAIGECMIEFAPVEDGLYRLGYAGDTFNTAYYAAALLPPGSTTSYLSAVGDDKASAEMLAFMRMAGVSTQFIRTVPGASPGLYVIHLDSAERSFSYWRSHSAARHLADDAVHMEEALSGASIVYFSGITLAILSPRARDNLHTVLIAARGTGSGIAFDPNIRPRLWENSETIRREITRFASLADIVLPSFDDEKAHFGDADPAATASRYHAIGAPHVIVKDGANGAFVSVSDNAFHVPAERMDDVVDTTGAGDSFNAGYLASYSLRNDAGSAARFANALAGQVVRHRGALMPKASIPAL
jgi:2-dehydro-3-deoxygluconokinase